MGTTATQAFPYPEATASPFVHLDLKALAEAVDAKLAAIPKIQSGNQAVGIIANGGASSLVVTFPVAFATVPKVVCTPGSARLGVAIESVSTTQVTLGFNNFSGASSSASTAHWVAVGT